jgi:hypothetical protein
MRSINECIIGTMIELLIIPFSICKYDVIGQHGMLTSIVHLIPPLGFVCFELQEQFFSYLRTVTITGDGAANLVLCLALTAFSSEGSFACHTYCDMELLFLRSYPKDLTSEFRALGKGAITTYFKLLRFDMAGPSGAQTHDLLDAKQEHYH